VFIFFLNWFVRVSGTTMLAVHDPVSADTIGYMLQGVIQEYKCIEWKYNTGFFLI